MDFNSRINQISQEYSEWLSSQDTSAKIYQTQFSVKAESEYKCSNKDCQNGLIYYKDENGSPCTRYCECFNDRRMARRLKFAELPEAFKSMELNTFRTGIYKSQDSRQRIGIACKIIQAYLDSWEEMKADGKGLYLYSDAKGSGKTRMAVSVANELMRKHDMRVKFGTSLKILDEIRRTWNKESEYTESALLDALYTTDVLIIDDFGVETSKDWIVDKYNGIINERYQNRKVTIFTSNVELEALPYGERVISRVKERSFVIPFPEECVREYIAEEDNKKIVNQAFGA